MVDPDCRAASPLTLMMRPHPPRDISGATSRAHRRYPITFVFTSSQSASVVSSASFGGATTPPGHGRRVHEDVDAPERAGQRRDHRPHRFVVAGVARTRPTMRRPVSVDELRGGRVDALLVAAAIPTSAPSNASRRTTALPIPRLPPVTIAFFPVSSKSMTQDNRSAHAPPLL